MKLNDNNYHQEFTCSNNFIFSKRNCTKNITFSDSKEEKHMVVKKNQLNDNKKLEQSKSVENFFFISLSSLSLLFLLVGCWILLTGDDVIFLHGSIITPRHFCALLYIQSFLLNRAVSIAQNNSSEAEQLFWSFSPAYHV